MVCSLPGSSVHGIFQQEYWSGLPFPFPGDLLDPGIEPGSPALQADTLPSETPWKPWSSPGQNTGVGSFIPSPVDLPNPGIEPGSLALQADSLPTELSGKPLRSYNKPQMHMRV